MSPDPGNARAGVVGLGAMGAPIARHLLRAGFDVTCFDIDRRAERGED